MSELTNFYISLFKKNTNLKETTIQDNKYKTIAFKGFL